MKGDKEKFNNQVIANLIDNSFKYTNEGEIIVSLSEKDEKLDFQLRIPESVLLQMFYLNSLINLSEQQTQIKRIYTAQVSDYILPKRL